MVSLGTDFAATFFYVSKRSDSMNFMISSIYSIQISGYNCITTRLVSGSEAVADLRAFAT